MRIFGFVVSGLLLTGCGMETMQSTDNASQLSSNSSVRVAQALNSTSVNERPGGPGHGPGGPGHGPGGPGHGPGGPGHGPHPYPQPRPHPYPQPRPQPYPQPRPRPYPQPRPQPHPHPQPYPRPYPYPYPVPPPPPPPPPVNPDRGASSCVGSRYAYVSGACYRYTQEWNYYNHTCGESRSSVSDSYCGIYNPPPPPVDTHSDAVHFVTLKTTFFKLEEKQSADLPENEKCALSAGTQVLAKIIAQHDKHMYVELEDRIYGCNIGFAGVRGYLYTEHVSW